MVGSGFLVRRGLRRRAGLKASSGRIATLFVDDQEKYRQKPSLLAASQQCKRLQQTWIQGTDLWVQPDRASRTEDFVCTSTGPLNQVSVYI
eukprot:4451122-Amphidinium_carterae.1